MKKKLATRLVCMVATVSMLFTDASIVQASEIAHTNSEDIVYATTEEDSYDDEGIILEEYDDEVLSANVLNICDEEEVDAYGDEADAYGYGLINALDCRWGDPSQGEKETSMYFYTYAPGTVRFSLKMQIPSVLDEDYSLYTQKIISDISYLSEVPDIREHCYVDVDSEGWHEIPFDSNQPFLLGNGYGLFYYVFNDVNESMYQIKSPTKKILVKRALASPNNLTVEKTWEDGKPVYTVKCDEISGVKYFFTGPNTEVITTKNEYVFKDVFDDMNHWNSCWFKVAAISSTEGRNSSYFSCSEEEHPWFRDVENIHIGKRSDGEDNNKLYFSLPKDFDKMLDYSNNFECVVSIHEKTVKDKKVEDVTIDTIREVMRMVDGQTSYSIDLSDIDLKKGTKYYAVISLRREYKMETMGLPYVDYTRATNRTSSSEFESLSKRELLLKSIYTDDDQIISVSNLSNDDSIVSTVNNSKYVFQIYRSYTTARGQNRRGWVNLDSKYYRTKSSIYYDEALVGCKLRVEMYADSYCGTIYSNELIVPKYEKKEEVNPFDNNSVSIQLSSDGLEYIPVLENPITDSDIKKNINVTWYKEKDGVSEKIKTSRYISDDSGIACGGFSTLGYNIYCECSYNDGQYTIMSPKKYVPKNDWTLELSDVICNGLCEGYVYIIPMSYTTDFFYRKEVKVSISEKDSEEVLFNFVKEKNTTSEIQPILNEDGSEILKPDTDYEVSITVSEDEYYQKKYGVFQFHTASHSSSVGYVKENADIRTHWLVCEGYKVIWKKNSSTGIYSYGFDECNEIYAVEAHVDEDKDGLCDICGHEAHVDHVSISNKYYSDASHHWKQCECKIGDDEICNEKIDYESHVDENKDGICDICLLPAHLEHISVSGKYYSDEKYHWKECECEIGDGEICNEKIGYELHVDKNKDGICDICLLPAHNEHLSISGKYYSDSYYHWKQCECKNGNNEICNEIIGYESHVDENKDGKCDICGLPSHVHHYSVNLKYYADYDSHWKVCDFDGCEEIINKGLHIDLNNDGKCDICRNKIHKAGLMYVEGLKESYTYNGKAITPEIEVWLGGKLLKKDIDYKVTYKNNINACDKDATNKKAPTIVVTGIGNYNATISETFTIVGKDISLIELDDIFAKDTGKSIKVNPDVILDSKKLKIGKDYEIVQVTDRKIAAFKEKGEYKLKVKGIGNYTGEKEFSLVISNDNLASKIKLDKIPNQKYTGAEIKPEITINKAPVDNEKFEIKYTNNIDAGTATVYVKAKSGSGYMGTKKTTFKITGEKIKGAKLSEKITDVSYNGENIEPEFELTLKSTALIKDTDYTVEYKNNVDAGKATAIVKGKGKYTGSTKYTYKIAKCDVEKVNDDIKVEDISGVLYTKSGATPSPVVTFKGEVLNEGEDYSVKYINNKVASVNDSNGKVSNTDPTLKIVFKGNFTGSISKAFDINVKPIENVEINVPDVIYSEKSNKWQQKNIVLTDTDGKNLKENTDYVVSGYFKDEACGEEIKDEKLIVGQKVYVLIEGKGNYTGRVVASYSIKMYDISSAKVTLNKKYEYTGEAVTVDYNDIKVTDKKGKELTANVDYVIDPMGYTNNVEKGTASFKIVGIGNYGGMKTVNFQIGSQKLPWWKDNN